MQSKHAFAREKNSIRASYKHFFSSLQRSWKQQEGNMNLREYGLHESLPSFYLVLALFIKNKFKLSGMCRCLQVNQN